MGCGSSRSQPTSPASTQRAAHVDNDNWMFYAPRHEYRANDCLYCGQPNRRGYIISNVSDYADGQSHTRSSSCWSSDEGRPYSPRPPYSNRSYTPQSTPSYSSPGNRSYTPQSTAAYSSPGQASPRLYTPQSTSTYSSPTQTSDAAHTPRPPPLRPLMGPTSSATGTSRTYSLLSTPTFHSPSSHPKNGLTLDPTLFSNNMSPFAQATRANKIDTDCASRFSGTSGSLSAFTSPTSSHKADRQRYPLTPLSVHTEPFPRVQSDIIAPRHRHHPVV